MLAQAVKSLLGGKLRRTRLPSLNTRRGVRVLVEYSRTNDVLIMMRQDFSDSYHCICVRSGFVYDSLLSAPISVDDFDFDKADRVYELEWERK